MVRVAALPRRGLFALFVCGQSACAFDSGGAIADGPPDPGSVGGRPDAGFAAPGSPDGGPAPTGCPADQDLLACLTFDGSAEDGSGYRNSIQVGGAPSFAGGISGLALAAGDGIDVTISETSVLDPTLPLLIELWARADALPADGARAGLVDNEAQWGVFVHAGGRVSCSMAGTVEGVAVLAVGGWTHLACAYDGSAIRLFADGSLVAEASAGSALATGGSDGTAIARNSPSGQYFAGLIDDVRIWRRGAP